jgi:hypothetical protein
MEATKGLTNLQLELVKLFSFEVSEDQLKELKQILVNYFASKITEDMDKLFEENNWEEGKIEEWSREHMRTKYE